MSKLSELTPPMRDNVEKIILWLKAKGVDVGIEPTYGGRRTVEQQRKIVGAGHSQILKSHHLTGNAADLYEVFEDAMTGHKSYKWPRKRAALLIGSAALALGIGWGGLFFNNKLTRWFKKNKVKKAILAARDKGWPVWCDEYNVDIGWDACHVQMESNWP